MGVHLANSYLFLFLLECVREQSAAAFGARWAVTPGSVRGRSWYGLEMIGLAEDSGNIFV